MSSSSSNLNTKFPNKKKNLNQNAKNALCKTLESLTMIPEAVESPRKRLLADPKPKHNPSSSAAAAASSPSDPPNHRKKNTRDLPNLSDCHACGFHTDPTNPRLRLQTLPSFWRVVLLCRPCLKLVQSSNLCSYCFSPAGNPENSHRCPHCHRLVHVACVATYHSSAPWSYCPELGPFRVCIDCWVPKPLENSIRVRKRRRTRSNKSQLGLESERKTGEKLEAVVSDAKGAVERKATVAGKAKEEALRKAVVARKTKELANGLLDLVARKDGSESSGSGSGGGSSSGGCEAIGVDAELAFQLHRAMNSSPRISGNLCLVNSSCLSVPRSGKGVRSLLGSRGSCKLVEDGDASVGLRGSPGPSVNGLMEECPTHRLNETTEGRVLQPEVKVYVRRSGSGHCTHSSNSKRYKFFYTRRGKKDEGCQGKGVAVDGNRDTCDDSSLMFEPETCRKQDEAEFELLHLDEARNPNRQDCEGNGAMLNVERSNGKPDRYLLKYSKRPQKELEYKLHPDETRNQNQVSCSGNSNMPLDESCNAEWLRYMIKYSTRRAQAILQVQNNFHCDDSTVESEARALVVGLTAFAHVLSEDPS